MTNNRKLFTYLNKYTGKIFYLNQPPNAVTDTEVYFSLWLPPQPSAQDKGHIPDAGNMIIPAGWKLIPMDQHKKWLMSALRRRVMEEFRKDIGQCWMLHRRCQLAESQAECKKEQRTYVKPRPVIRNLSLCSIMRNSKCLCSIASVVVPT